MASETIYSIDWSHPSPSWAVPSELHVLRGVNAAYKTQDLLQQSGLEYAFTGMPDQRNVCAATDWQICRVSNLQINHDSISICRGCLFFSHSVCELVLLHWITALGGVWVTVSQFLSFSVAIVRSYLIIIHCN